MNKTNFFLYSKNPSKMKQAVEVFNLFMKDVPYYIYFTNLTIEENRTKLSEIMDAFRENFDKIQNNFNFLVVDNEKVKNILN